jgi:two-component system cell cycle sensor histidine kinase/response regulator CckA
MVEQAAHQASGVTRSLLTFSRKSVAEWVPTNMTRLVTDTLRLLRRMLPASIDMVDDVSSVPAVWLHTDPTQMQQVLMNLVVNARDAMPEGGKLCVSLRWRESREVGRPADSFGTAQLRVSDTGVGMTPEVRQRMFEPFFTTKPREQGTGLGMSVINSIVTSHHGSISVDSVPGRGTHVTVLVPCCAAPTAAPAPPPVKVRRGRGEVIIVVEDDEQIRAIMTSALRGQGYEVVPLASGEALHETMEEHDAGVRLVVMDLDLPGRSGLVWITELKKLRPDLSFLVVTGRVDVEFEAVLPPGVPYLCKPFPLKKLTETVSKTLVHRSVDMEATAR